MLFDGPHLLYIFISLPISVLILYLAYKYIKAYKHKEWFLKFWALVTVFLHLLPLWVDFLMGEQPIAKDNQLFPIYFCNMSMYLLVITAFWGDKQSKSFRYLATITSYAGTLGALISLFYPDYYLGSGNMLALPVMKSMLSHSTMMIGALYFMVGGYFKVRVKENTIDYMIGLLGFGLIGVLVNTLFKVTGRGEPNAMFLQRPPIEEAPFLNVVVIAILMVGVVALTSFLIERRAHKHVPKSEDALSATS